MNVFQVMSRNMATCGPDDTLDAAASKMWDRDIGSLPVVDGEDRLVGMVTDRDICMAAYTQGRSLKDTRVGTAMASAVHFGRLTDQLHDIEAIMRTHQIRRVPIVDAEQHVVGIVSLGDLIREAAAERRRHHPDVPTDELVTTLAAICEPRQTEGLPLAAE